MVKIVKKEKDSVELTCSLGATISTEQYANLTPRYEIKQVLPNDVTPGEMLDTMRVLLKSKIDADFELVRVEKIRKTLKGVRFTEKSGVQYPHVTSIIGAINPITFPYDKLVQYGSRGTLHHIQAEHYVKTGEWVTDFSLLPGTKLDFQVVTQGSEKLPLDKCNFKGFWDLYKDDFEIINMEQLIFNDTHIYCGSYDFLAKYKGRLAIVDIKTSSKYDSKSLERHYKQLSAYAMTLKDIETLVIIPINPSKKEGFEACRTTDDIDKYFTLFMQDRDAFKEMYTL